MKDIRLCIAVIAAAGLIATSCNKKTKNIDAFTNIEWYLDYSLVIVNDSAFSYASYDTVLDIFSSPNKIPLHLTDSTMILSRYKPVGTYDSKHNFHVKKCELNTDTVRYDIKYINKRPKLIIYTDPFPIITKYLPILKNFIPNIRFFNR